jgi:FlaA1/EpsC-like NDP-sugar epimerase
MFFFLANPVKRKQYLLMAGDGLVVLGAILLAYTVRFTLEGTPLSTIQQRMTWMIPAMVAVHLLAFYVFELYDLGKRFPTGRGGLAVLGAVVASWGELSILSFLFPGYKLGRVVLALYVSVAAPAAFLWRKWFFGHLLHLSERRNLLLVGSDTTVRAQKPAAGRLGHDQWHDERGTDQVSRQGIQPGGRPQWRGGSCREGLP